MPAVLASHGCYLRDFEMINQGRRQNDFSFSWSISNVNFLEPEAYVKDSWISKRPGRFLAELSQRQSHKLGANGSATRMVPTTELMRGKGSSLQKESVNGTNADVSRVSIVKRNATSAMVKSPKTTKRGAIKEAPFIEDLKVFPSDKDFSWSKDTYSSWQRTIDIWSFIISFQTRVLFDNAKWAYPGGFTEEKQKARIKKTASWLREQVLQLGPVFIKVGQVSSTRSDLFPREFVDELAKLQDRVPAFSADKARASIQKELGAPVEMLFKEFEDRPLAAASLGQVHRAVLRNGEKVVVKIQRPGLRNLFEIDLKNLRLVAEYFQRSETFGGPSRDWIAVYEEYSKILYQEIDYINEGKNADRLRRDFRNIKWVRVPFVLWDYTSEKVLTLEYVPGLKINSLDQIDARGYNRSLIASRAVESYLIQLLSTGFFHADPHPGNLAIDVDGALIYYDFGMMGEIKSFTRERLLGLFYAVYENDVNKVIKNLIDLEALQPTGDLSPVRRSIQFFLDNLMRQTPDQQQTFSAVGEDLFAIAQDQPLRFPASFTFVIRAFLNLEGIGSTLDPEFSFVKIAAPYAQELLDVRQKQRSGAELVQELRQQANDARNSTISMPYRIQRIEEFVKQLEAGDLKLRVRVLESERSAKKVSILQMATIYTVLSGSLLNVGINLSSQGNQAIANGTFVGAGVFLILLARSMNGVKKLDDFEKML